MPGHGGAAASARNWNATPSGIVTATPGPIDSILGSVERRPIGQSGQDRLLLVGRDRAGRLFRRGLTALEPPFEPVVVSWRGRIRGGRL